MLEEFDDVRVLLVANQPILAEALAVRVEAESGLVFVGASADWATATRAMSVERPDVVIIDVALLPGGAQPVGALELIDRDTCVILVVQDERPELARNALLRGAAGLVST